MLNNKTTRGKIKKEYLAYIAGVIDSDGSISVSKINLRDSKYKSPRYVLAVTITNTSEELIDFVQERMGGSYRDKKRRDRRQETTIIKENGIDRIITAKRITYDWTIASTKALNFLRLIKNYLIAKKRQAELAIEFQENILNKKTVCVKAGLGISHRLAPEEIKKRDWYNKTISALNKQTLSPTETERGNPYI